MAAETSDGGGRRQRAAFDGGSGRRSVAETGPKTEETGETEEAEQGTAVTAGRRRAWAAAAATPGGADGRWKGSGAGDRRQREEAEKKEADGEGRGGRTGSRAEAGEMREKFGFIFGLILFT